MDKTKISIIIPVHNTELYLKECLDSVVNQTLKDIEVICIDDASTDNSLSILQEYSNKDNRIKIIHNEIAKSALGARKKGVDAANGRYIMCLDADDYLSVFACEQLYNKIEEVGVEILNFNTEVVNCANLSKEKIVGVQQFLVPYMNYLNETDVFKGCFVNNLYGHNLWSKIYKAELCKRSFEDIEDIYMPFAEDLYTYFVISYYAVMAEVFQVSRNTL